MRECDPADRVRCPAAGAACASGGAGAVGDWIAEGEKVVIREAIAGMHQGLLETALGPLPATGRQATWAGIPIWRIADGKVAQWWGLIDELSILQQLGALPTPQSTPAP